MKSNLIRPTTVEQAFKTSPYLRWQDVRELEGAGHNPMFCLPLSVGVSEAPIAFYTPEDEIAGMAGIRREDEDSGVVWMLCTKAVERYPLLLVKQAKEWIDNQQSYKILHNIADPRNTLHMKLLKLLGFKRLGFQQIGPSRLTFVEFAKLVPCALH